MRLHVQRSDLGFVIYFASTLRQFQAKGDCKSLQSTMHPITVQTHFFFFLVLVISVKYTARFRTGVSLWLRSHAERHSFSDYRWSHERWKESRIRVFDRIVFDGPAVCRNGNVRIQKCKRQSSLYFRRVVFCRGNFLKAVSGTTIAVVLLFIYGGDLANLLLRHKVIQLNWMLLADFPSWILESVIITIFASFWTLS